MIFRVSSAHEEGGERVYSVSTKEFLGDERRATSARCGWSRSRCATAVQGGRGHRAGDPGRAGAARDGLHRPGAGGPRSSSSASSSTSAATSCATTATSPSVAGVFVAGDAGRGQSLIVWAIAEGRAAAAAVDTLPDRRDHAAGADPADRAPAGGLTASIGATSDAVADWNDPAIRVGSVACVEPRSSAPSVPPPRPPSAIRELVEAGMDVARLNLSHGSLRRPREGLPHGPRGLRRRPAAASASSSTCRARRSGSARSPTARSTLEPGEAFTITTRDVPGDATICSHDLRRAARRRRRPATRS